MAKTSSCIAQDKDWIARVLLPEDLLRITVTIRILESLVTSRT